MTCMNVKFVSFMQRGNKENSIQTLYFGLLNSFMRTINFFRFPYIRLPSDVHEKSYNHRVTEFCYKSVNLLLGELVNIKVILFLILELFR